ncbi:MAG TPA: glycosyl hydrolase family 8, partial [Candidatus Didemnitutus sp.]|nr:glycosyl hydrolase family 8 [Candidatus Didemnitutus sp.]
MRFLRLVPLCLGLAATSLAAVASDRGAFAAGHQRNLFAELLGKTDAQVDAKIAAAWQQLFYGNDQEQRVYYPVAGDMAYIADIGSNDVRSEGMSYGMMLAVQMDKRAEFDRLWRWAKKYMYHTDGPRRGYFAWHCKFDGTQLDPGSASDGEEWFAMALLFAANRWGNGGAFNYNDEAQALLHEMLHKPATAEVTSIFDLKQKQVVFAPSRQASTFTDPSYHLPAFYELWARWSVDPSDRAFWADAARTSREFFHRAAHPKTGLMPEYAHFDGKPYTDFGPGRGDFRFDAHRTLANVALDHAWFAADPWQIEQSNRVLRFLTAQGPKYANQFTLAGKPLSQDSSAGLAAMAAVAGLAADPQVARPFVQQLWDTEIPSGHWRYYNGMLYFLGLLQASGRFQIY